MVAFRKPKSLSEYLVQASFRSGSKDEVKGTSKCNANRCQICNFLCLGRVFRNNKTGKEFSINYDLNCNSRNVIYLLLVENVKFKILKKKLTFLNSNSIWKVSPISTRVLDLLTLK